jgi:hypothetical protein
MDNRGTQQEAAEALLDAGVSVPLKSIKIPFRKKPLVIRLTMKRPRLSTQIRIAQVYLGMGVTAEQLGKFTKEEEMKFLAEHGKDIARMMAMAVCCTTSRTRLFGRLLTWIIIHYVEDIYLKAALMNFILLLGTGAFTNIIRSVEMTNPMKLRLSHKRKGS